MSYESVHQIIRAEVDKKLVKGGDGVSPATIQFPNMTLSSYPVEPWAELVIRPIDRQRVSLGGGSKGRYRYTGMAIFVIRSPAAKGDRETLEFIDRIEVLFRSVTLTTSGVSVTFRVPRITDGPTVFGSWWMANLTCPFYSDFVAS